MKILSILVLTTVFLSTTMCSAGNDQTYRDKLRQQQRTQRSLRYQQHQLNKTLRRSGASRSTRGYYNGIYNRRSEQSLNSFLDKRFGGPPNNGGFKGPTSRPNNGGFKNGFNGGYRRRR